MRGSGFVTSGAIGVGKGLEPRIGATWPGARGLGSVGVDEVCGPTTGAIPPGAGLASYAADEEVFVAYAPTGGATAAGADARTFSCGGSIAISRFSSSGFLTCGGADGTTGGGATIGGDYLVGSTNGAGFGG
jgi:hypothetical protein